jgi:phage baseplate assembly protein gpV
MDGMAIERTVVELAEQSRQLFYGKYKGTVTDVDDPESLGRIRVLVPDVYHDLESPWAKPCTPYAGPDIGFYAVPPVGAAVWVEFEKGDPSLPIWSGGWWDNGRLPKDEKAGDTKPPLKILRSEHGLLLAFDDANDTATLSDQDGSNLLTIKVGDGEVRIQASAKVVVEAPHIELTDGAPHPLVFGDNLLNYLTQLVMIFNAHMHPGETTAGIPVTPIIPTPQFPSPADLLSSRVTTG